MTNILVPTDFTPGSVKIAESALRSGHYDKCNLLLFHAFRLPWSQFDLLGAQHIDPSHELLTEAFRQSCKQLKDDYGKQVGKIIVRCLTGSTRAIFRNFLEANDVDLIYCPDDFLFRPVHERSVDPLYLFRKCGIPVVKSGIRKAEPAFSSAFFPNIPATAR